MNYSARTGYLDINCISCYAARGGESTQGFALNVNDIKDVR